MANLGTLTYDIVAKLDKLESGLNRAERIAKKKADRMHRVFTRLASSIGVALGSIGLAAAVDQSLDFADALGKAADAAGISTTKLQELRYAFDKFGVSAKGTDDVMRRFNRRLGVAFEGGSFKKPFDQLGISLLDVNKNARKTEDVFDDVVAKMGNMENASLRASYAAQLFGDDFGPKIAKALGAGSTAINQLALEAHDLGLILSDELIDNAEQANDDLSRLSNVLRVQLVEAFVTLAPYISDAAGFVLELARSARVAFGDVNKLSASLVKEKISNASQYLQELYDQLEKVRANAKDGGVSGKVENLFLPSEETLQKKIANTLKIIEEGYGRLGEINLAKFEKPDIGLGGVGEDLETAARKAADLQVILDRLFPKDALARKFKEELTLVTSKFGEASDQAKALREEYEKALDKLGDDAASEAMKALRESTLDAVDPTRKLVQELLKLEELANSDIGADIGDAIAERMLQIQEEIDEVINKSEDMTDDLSVFAEQAARNMQNSMTEYFFDPFDKGLEGMVQGMGDAIRRMAANLASSALLEASGVENLLKGVFSGNAGGAFWDFIGGLPFFASGTSFAPGGLAVVGERGPELVNLPRGSEVIPHNRVDQYMSRGEPITVNVYMQSNRSDSRQTATQAGYNAAAAIERARRRNG